MRSTARFVTRSTQIGRTSYRALKHCLTGSSLPEGRRLGKPERGLEQFRNVAGGSFNGVHRARADARNAGSVLNPNPGYNKGDFNPPRVR